MLQFKTILFLFTLGFTANLFAQEENVIETDSSIIKTKYFEYLYSVREFNELKDKPITYYKEWHPSTKVIKEKGKFKDGNRFGIWLYFLPNGELEKKIDFRTDDTTFYKEINQNEHYNTWKQKYDYSGYSQYESDSIRMFLRSRLMDSVIEPENIFLSLDSALIDPEKVMVLHLDGFGLNEIPSFICEFKNLEVLELRCESTTIYESNTFDVKYEFWRCNHITEIPDDIYCLNKLKILALPWGIPYNALLKARRKLPYCYVIAE